MKEDVKSQALKALIKKFKGESYEKPIRDGMAVKVMADSPEALKKGLEKAKEIVESPEEVLKEAVESEPEKKLGEDVMEDMVEKEEEKPLEEMSREELIALLKAKKEMV